MSKKFIFSFAIAAFLGTNAHAISQFDTSDSLPDNTDDYYEQEVEIYDPIEPVNRAIFEFNNVVDGVLLKPVAQIYEGVVPQWGRDRVSNVLYNLSEPIIMINSALQGDDVNAFTSLWRFIINSTFGLLGTFDAASEIGLEPRKEDFGQTLYVWGVEESPYLVLPLLGPSTLRDGVGVAVDYYVDPLNYEEVFDDEERVIHSVAEVINSRTELLPVTEKIDNTAIDPYATYRALFLQKRKSDALNGDISTLY
ncbi:MAG: hypothetical protein COV36_00685 [Alphaproteobacteria bacterium CG11_big_fil_rev_8_21_14_0_20_44_7]|nr:MAG: hypothetical protein COV36_00685 [Alphaproteobacteria bacterium CG11_big_fil_rev_8_21_14_0_20_44_7]